MLTSVWRGLAWIKAKLLWVIPVVMLAGLLFGALADASFLKPAILPLTLVMIYPMMVNLQIKKVLSGHDYKLQLVTLLINLVVIPLAAYVIGRLFFADNVYAALGLLLAATLPTSGMTISWTGFAKGNLDAAIKMVVLSLVLGALVSPLLVKLFMGTVVAVPVAKIFQQIALTVLGPLVLGYATQRLVVAKVGQATYAKEVKPKMPLLSTVGLMGMVFSAIALKANTILANPGSLLGLFVPLILFYLLSFALGALAGRSFFGREDGIALIYGVGPKNLSIALAIAMNAFGKQGADIALIIALAYVIQIQASAWCNKAVDKCFDGPAEKGRPALVRVRS